MKLFHRCYGYLQSSSLSEAKIVLEMVLEPLECLDDERFEALECFAGQSSVVQLLEKAQQIGAIPADRDLHNETLMYERIAHYQKALQLYQVPPLPVEIHQLYATEPLLSRRARAAKPSLGPVASSPMRSWDRVLGAAAIHAVPIQGNHMTMMIVPENGRVLARSLSAALNSSQTTARGAAVKRGKRLDHHKQSGLGQQRQADGDALPLPAGEM